MGTKNLVMLKTHVDSIKLCFANDFVYENVLWPLVSLLVFFSNYLVSSMGFILTSIFRFQRKKEHLVEDYEINRLTEELANFIFPSCEDFVITSEEIDENKTEYSVFFNCDSDFHQDGSKIIEKIEENETEEEEVQEEEEEIVGFEFEEEPMKFSFSFLHNFRSENISDNAIFITTNITKEELLEDNLVQLDIVSKEDEEKSIQKQCEGFECKTLKPIEDVEKIQLSIDIEKTKETVWENEMDYEEDEEEDEEYDEDEDELLEQIKLELRNARQGGLATILEDDEDEERESLKVVSELKPLRIEEKIEYKDHIIEIQKFYRCYAEKIRKLDVLNYQAMQAIGLLQLKEPLKIMQMPKSTFQHAKPIISKNLWPRKAPKQKYDPMLKLVHEVHRDLELVYVGQVCLSWEILCWQHRKIQELKKYDSQLRPHRYNLVAGEFQLFRVLMQRFIEDESFQQESRIQNYVQNRFVIRNLLQVPSIKDDNTKDKKKVKWSEDDEITSEKLAHIIKECMQVFWEFVQADKDDVNMFRKISHQNMNDVNEMEISDLLRDIQIQLQKKEKKLKDRMRIGNCIIRKFQKDHESKIQLDHEHLLAQVELRLISRVINMKKLRKDQLVWCNEKLNQIKFVGREVQVEPSFLLFPC